jgi:hypothetical protein
MQIQMNFSTMTPDSDFPAAAALEPQLLAVPGVRGELSEHNHDEVDATFMERTMDFLYLFSLWFSLPLAIWLSSSRMGLVLHWQAVKGRSAGGEYLKTNRNRN